MASIKLIDIIFIKMKNEINLFDSLIKYENQI